MISRAQNKASSNIYFENIYIDYNTDWTAIYMLPHLITYNTYMRSFQYKILDNVLFLNKKLHTLGIKPSPLCSFCNLCNETPYHIFYECDRVKRFWSDLVQYFQNNLILPTLTRKVNRTEKEIASTNSKKTIAFTTKWNITNNIVP